MNQSFSPLVLKHQFTDFDAFTASLPDWQVSFKQLDRGAFIGDIEQIITDRITIKRCRFNRRLEQLGVAPPGCRTFGITMADHSPFYWRRHQIEAGNLMTFEGDVEMDGVSSPGFHLYAVSIDNGLLNHAAQQLGYDSHEEILEREQVNSCSEGDISELRQVCQSAINPTDHTPNSMRYFVDQIHDDLPSLMLKRFLAGGNNLPMPSQPSRSRALKVAREVVAEAECPITTVAELSQLTNTNKRTLHYAFKEAYGVSPKAYLQATRLNAVRQNLLNTKGQISISDVANQQGFWHMGQFAADFQKMFGELPSSIIKTLSGK